MNQVAGLILLFWGLGKLSDYFVLRLGHAFIPHAADPSFPSDHVTIFAGVGLSLLLGHARSVVGWAMLLLGLCVAWARVFLGVLSIGYAGRGSCCIHCVGCDFYAMVCLWEPDHASD